MYALSSIAKICLLLVLKLSVFSIITLVHVLPESVEAYPIVSGFVSEYVSDEQLTRVQKVIRNHHSHPETIEGKILQDADELAKYGVSDIWRMIHYASEEEMTIEEGIENFRNTLRPRLEKGLAEFNFDVTRNIAERRMKKQEDFISEMEREMSAKDM